MGEVFRLVDVEDAYSGDDARVCASCRRTLPKSAFPVSNKSHTGSEIRRPDCRNCHNEHKRFCQQFRDSGRFNIEFRRQGGACKCCKRTDVSVLHVDHNHKTMAFRGLLCESCNVGGGKLGGIEQALRWALYLLENDSGG
jgi:hypothetical protein